MKTQQSIKQIMIALMVVLISSLSYGQFDNSGGYQGGGHGSGGDETLDKCQELTIFDGWSGVSSYVSPYEKDAENLFDPLGSALTILYNLNGMYWPSTSTNTLGSWDAYSGYVIKVIDDAYLRMCGDEVSDKTVSLNATWDLIPVLSTTNANVENLFAGLIGFELVKAIGGSGVYWPLYNVNTLYVLKPGNAYWVYTTSAGTINFSTKSGNPVIESPVGFVNTSPWKDIHHTPATHIVALTKGAVQVVQPGDIIGAFTAQGLCTGLLEYNGNETALSLNGDDGLTGAIDGFIENENISYKLYRPSTKETFDMEVEYETSLDNSGQFHINGMSAITDITLTAPMAIGETLSGLEGTGIRIYPNPSHGIFNIEGMDVTVDVTIYNPFGGQVISNEMDLPQKLDLSSQPVGVYFIRISTNDGVHFEKLVIN